MKRLKIYLLAVFLLSLCLPFSGCEDEDDNSHLSSEEAIIGNWKLIKRGPDEDHIEPVDFDRWLEFRPDKTMQRTNHSQRTFYMDQECLYLQDTKPWIYEYKFTNKKNTLTLKTIYENVIPLIILIPGKEWVDYSVNIYRRVK
ncbi:MAG: hypothetical protein LBG15_07265 [Dysgonamonadaceae bacterium]|jgi:hypothetical protein|nr:hypothetical protein [Dysgonamonadaceae bacterium]